MEKKLYKSRKNKMISGVCGGIADYFGIDATVVRLVFAALAILKGAGVILYLLAWILIPSLPGSELDSSSEDDIDNLKSANVDDSAKGKKRAHSDEEFDSFFKKK